MKLQPHQRERIELEIHAALARLDAASEADHDSVIAEESNRLVLVMNDEGVDADLAHNMLEKMKEVQGTKRELARQEKILEIIKSSEQSLIRSVSRSALTSGQAVEMGAALQIEGELWPSSQQLPIVAQVPEKESRHGAFAAEHSALRIYADEEQHEAIFVRAISKLAGLSARRGGFVIDRDALEDAEQKMSEHNNPTDSTLSLATKPQNLEVSRELAARVARKMGTDLPGLKKIWQQDFDDLCNWARALAKQWTAPPIDHCVSATNVEAFAMAVIHFTVANADCPWVKDGTQEEQSTIWDGITDRVPEFERVRNRVGAFYKSLENDPRHARNLRDLTEEALSDPVIGGSTERLGERLGEILSESYERTSLNTDVFHAFGIAWRDSSYARLEIGHKLAASLCLTDTDGVEVQSPWLACSIVVPDGLFPTLDVAYKSEVSVGAQVARLWCLNTQVIFAVMSDGGVIADLANTMEPRAVSALESLARGAFLALANPDEFKKKTTTTSASSSKTNNRNGPPDLTQAKYMLSAPVSIDMRDLLTEHLSGKRKGGGGAPKVQFLVRGHWKQQAHGPRHSLRKTIWVKPFWKGPDDTRVLLRTYQVKDES